MLFHALLCSLKIIILRHIPVIVYINSSFFYISKQYSIVWLYHILFSYSSFHVHLGCFQFGTIINSAAMNIHVSLSVDIHCLLS